MAEQNRDPVVSKDSTGARDDELDLIELAKVQPEAFGRLYDRYYSTILNYVYHRTLDISLAEELTLILSSTPFVLLNAIRAAGNLPPGFTALPAMKSGSTGAGGGTNIAVRTAGAPNWNEYNLPATFRSLWKKSRRRRSSSPAFTKRSVTCRSGIRQS
jgi:hypothetical protein